MIMINIQIDLQVILLNTAATQMQFNSIPAPCALPRLQRGKTYASLCVNEPEWGQLKLVHNVLREPTMAQQSLSSQTTSVAFRTLPIFDCMETSWEEYLADEAYAAVHSGLEAGLANMRKWKAKAIRSISLFVVMVLQPDIKLSYFKALYSESTWLSELWHTNFQDRL